MLNARMITIVASSITLLGSSVTMSEARPARAQAVGCTYGYAAFCNIELCPLGTQRTCSSPCTMDECEDIVAYSCCSYSGN